MHFWILLSSMHLSAIMELKAFTSYICSFRRQSGSRRRQVMTLALFSMHSSSKRETCTRLRSFSEPDTRFVEARWQWWHQQRWWGVILCAGFDRSEGRTGGDIGNLEALILSALGLINEPCFKGIKVNWRDRSPLKKALKKWDLK